MTGDPTASQPRASAVRDPRDSGASGRNVRQLLLPYIGLQVALLIVIQVVTALRGPNIDWVDQVLLVPSAMLMMAFYVRYNTALSQIRFGRVVAHAATFGIVNGSYHLVAYVRAVSNWNGDQFPLDRSWFGPLIGMCGFWSIGLIIHISASVAQRGFES